MLRLRRCWQPSATRDALCIDKPLHNILGDDKQVFDRSEARVFLGGAAVNVRSTGRIVLDDGGSNFS
jgi:hypothetical protein